MGGALVMLVGRWSRTIAQVFPHATPGIDVFTERKKAFPNTRPGMDTSHSKQMSEERLPNAVVFERPVKHEHLIFDFPSTQQRIAIWLSVR